MSGTRKAHHAGRRSIRPGPRGLLLGASAIAALMLTLSVNGTLSSWTTAIISNSTNTTATAQAVILQEVGPDGTAGHVSQTCQSSSDPSNSYSCTNINKYGGTTTPLTPNTTVPTDVTFTNIGASAASSFVFTPGTCSQSPTAGSGTPAAADLCSGASGDLTVAVSCSSGATYSSGTAWSDLVQTGIKPGSLTAKTHTATLAAGAQWTCRITVVLATGASVLDQGITVTQPLTWTLNK